MLLRFWIGLRLPNHFNFRLYKSFVQIGSPNECATVDYKLRFLDFLGIDICVFYHMPMGEEAGTEGPGPSR